MARTFEIAVVLPTRGRTDALERSIVSLINRAVKMDRVQIILGFDEDDHDGQDHFAEKIQPLLDDRGVNYTAMIFEPLGYTRLNEYVNAMALASDADWIIFWNDDAVMDSAGWDRVITKHTGEFKLLAFHTHRDHPYSIFPIVPREWLDHLGYLSPHQISDAWLSQQAYMLDIWERIPVHVTHDRHDLTGNNNDDTYKNRVMYEGRPDDPHDFHHPQWTNRRMIDTDRISTYMKSQGMDISFWENVKTGKQNPWEKLRANDVNKQMMQYNIKFNKS